MSHLETIFIHQEVVVVVGCLGPTPVGNPSLWHSGTSWGFLWVAYSWFVGRPLCEQT